MVWVEKMKGLLEFYSPLLANMIEEVKNCHFLKWSFNHLISSFSQS